ncbi:MAG: ABC transporter substrate-binding protein [Chromatiales bacterium]|jgi:phospholipid transport system substrate-binding protein
MKIKLFTCSIFLLFFMAQLQASPGYGYPQPSHITQQQAAGPGEVLREGVTKLQQFMGQQESPSAESIKAFLDVEIAPYFDFAYMAKWTAGPAYRSMNEEQLNMLEQKIKAMLLSSLSQRLGGYDYQDVRFFRPRWVAKNEVKVRMGIVRPGRYPSSIDFRFYRGESGWKVFDVSANGSSALAFYRQYFARQANLSDRLKSTYQF